jgi:hypothetical protein
MEQGVRSRGGGILYALLCLKRAKENLVVRKRNRKRRKGNMLEASSEQTSQEACQDIESMSLGIAIFSSWHVALKTEGMLQLRGHAGLD